MYQNTKGFTLIELLISMQITILSGLILFMIVPHIALTTTYHSFQVYQFFGLLEREIQTSTAVNVTNEKLELTTMSGDRVTIEKYKQSIRRRVNNSGHEVLLQNVREFNVFRSDAIHIVILSEAGEVFEDEIKPFYQE